MIIAIVGPTAVGKTKLSIELAKKYGAEIINADAMQVYKGLDIGTAKITESEKEGILHHLFDCCTVNVNYTVYDYQKDCRDKIEDIIGRGKNVILVGGTGLYLKAALYDYKFKDEYVTGNYDLLSNEELYKKVLETNYPTDIHINNRKRLIRFLDKFENNDIEEKKGDTKIYDFFMIGLTTSRDILYNKINDRVVNMISNGLLDEVKSFYDKGIVSKALATGIGYKELYGYFNLEYSKESAIELIQKNSRHYAKRQYTFFNHQFDVTWFETDYNNFQTTIDEVVNYIDINTK